MSTVLSLPPSVSITCRSLFVLSGSSGQYTQRMKAVEFCNSSQFQI